MRRVVSVDVPILTAAGCGTSQIMRKLIEAESVLTVLNAHDCHILLGDSLYDLMSRNEQFPPTFWKTISNVNVERYDVSRNAELVNASPDVTATGLGVDIDTEIKAQLVHLHGQDNGVETIYVIDFSRGFYRNDKLDTEAGGATRRHELVNVSGETGLDSFFSRYTPKLVQLKHGQQQYIRRGNVVSPFSAYDPNDPSQAEALLDQAMNDYNDDYTSSTPPSDLYTWDAENRCYVVFHHSGRWEYHGHDLQSPYTEVPQYIKDKYHILK